MFYSPCEITRGSLPDAEGYLVQPGEMQGSLTVLVSNGLSDLTDTGKLELQLFNLLDLSAQLATLTGILKLDFLLPHYHSQAV